MRKSIRLISALLTVLMVVTSVGVGSLISASAATPAYEYLTTGMESQLAKLETMTLMKSQDGYNLYCDPYSGEVAFQKIATGQILFSNPYDTGSPTSANADTIKSKLLSQVFVEYEDSDGTVKEMYSYTEASERDQIIVKNIKNGIRVEYTMGRQEARRLVPRMIQKERLETLILDKIDNEYSHDRLKNFYVLMDPNDETKSERAIAEMKARYPITNRMAVYVYDSKSSDYELNWCESVIKAYCPDYTYETLDEDHAMTEYEGSDSAPPLFRLALEYTIDSEGLTARLAANGIRYDDTAYSLLSVTVLPYMGAISSENEGYTFMPDGAGALFTASDLAGITWNRTGQMYGPDYAYQEITGEHQEVLTVPVWGAVQSLDYTKTIVHENVVEEGYTTTDEETGETIVVDPVIETTTEKVDVHENKGYVAIITEGDSLATLKYENGGTLHKYAAIYASFCPRPSDEYNLSESIAAASNTTWRVESSRKYVDSYRIKYIMLDDEKMAEEAKLEDYYAPNYFGMAKAYREYLEGQGVLTRIQASEVTENIPLYIEVLGTMETTEKILSIPVTVDTPLTTFENIQTMYEELVAAGVDNVNFKLTGFANGGLSKSTVPYKLKWEKAVGGSDGFEALVAYAADKNLGIFPDFDFCYAANNKSFDGFTYRKHAVKTIDDRYTSKRYYNAMTQSYSRNFEIAISPSVFTHFYEKFNENYQKFNPTGISVSTLGTDLNSDFDEDDPYNREDSKRFTIELLDQISKDYDQVMVDGGNAYSFKYIDHIVNMNLNSSEFFNASYSVPFTGLVLHGYVQGAGTPANEEGDIENAILKSIETGTYLYFTLAYQNTSDLKEDENLNSYYSIRYDIWFDDMVEYYTYLNGILKDLQTQLIIGHELLAGERVPDADEIEADKLKAEEEAAAKAEADRIQAEKDKAAAELAARKEAEALEAEKLTALEDSAKLIDTINKLLAEVDTKKVAFKDLVASIPELEAAIPAAEKALEDANAALETATKANDDAQAALKAGDSSDEDAYAALKDAASAAKEALEAATKDVETATKGVETAKAAVTTALETIRTYKTVMQELKAEIEATVALAERKVEITEGAIAEIIANKDKVSAIAATAIANIEPFYADYDAAIALYELTPVEDKTEDDGAEDDDSAETPDGDEVPGDEAEPEEKPVSKYAVDDGSIVHVTYENGTHFILNYNRFAVTVEYEGTTYTIDAFSVVKF